MSRTIIFGCKALLFAPRCDLWDNKMGCIFGGLCSYKYDYQEMLRDNSEETKNGSM